MEETESYESERYEPLRDNYNSILLRLDPTPTLDTIKRFLMRQTVQDPKDHTRYITAKGAEPMLKEAGVEELMLELSGIMSVDKVLSNLEENNIRLTVREVGECVLEFMYFNKTKYDIKEADMSRIFFLIKHNVEIFLRRAKGGRDHELLAKQFLHRENVTRQGTSEEGVRVKPNMFNFFRK